MVLSLSCHLFQTSMSVRVARFLFFLVVIWIHFENAFAQSVDGSVPAGNPVPPMQAQAPQPGDPNIHWQPNAAPADPQKHPQAPDASQSQRVSVQQPGPGLAGSHANFEQVQNPSGAGQNINSEPKVTVISSDQPHAAENVNQPPRPNVNMQGILASQQGAPSNVQGVGFNSQGLPGNQQGVPVNVQGIPINPNMGPSNPQNVQMNPQGVPPSMTQQGGAHRPPQATPRNVQVPLDARNPLENQPVNPIPPSRDTNVPPNVPMAQVPHQPNQPILPGHPPPPHAAGIVFNGEHPAAFQHHPNTQFKNVPVGGDQVINGYNQFRHNHGPPDVNVYDHQRVPRSHEEYPPDEFASMTMIIPRGSKNCYFYTPVIDFIVYYQVVRGGAMDIGLRIMDPDGRNVINQRPSEDGKFSITVPSHFRMRPYGVCFDNRKASFDEKHVSMMVDIDVNWDNPSEAEKKAINFLRKRSLGDAHIPAMNREYAEGWKAIDERVEGLYGRLHRIKLLQQRSNNFASADKALMESNLARVSSGSFVQIVLMFGVAAFQVVLIRAFFDPDSRFYRIWFGKRSAAGARC